MSYSLYQLLQGSQNLNRDDSWWLEVWGRRGQKSLLHQLVALCPQTSYIIYPKSYFEMCKMGWFFPFQMVVTGTKDLKIQHSCWRAHGSHDQYVIRGHRCVEGSQIWMLGDTQDSWRTEWDYGMVATLHLEDVEWAVTPPQLGLSVLQQLKIQGAGHQSTANWLSVFLV